jgi:glycyl-tRNA synthetase
VYLRPDTAQGSYVNFLNVQTASRQRIPFGIAQIGKAFRNEITPGNFIFRTREFEQAEMQFFVEPGTDEEWFEKWLAERQDWHHSLGVRPENLRLHEHGPDELAHYAKKAFDIEYEYPFGWKEFEGIHNRTDFDLSRHQEYSGKRLEYIDAGTNERFVPYVVETAVGVDRTMLVALVDGYREEQVEGEERVVLGLHPKLAPIKVAVFPLKKNEPRIVEVAKRIKRDLQPILRAVYDDTGAIGKLYRRQDEIGTPFCITVDFETLGEKGPELKDTVTVRDRDSMQQERVAISELATYLINRLN